MSVSAMRGTCGSETTLSVSESATAQDSVINAYEKDCITLFILPSQGSWHPPGKSVIGMSLSLTAKFRRRMLLHLRPFPCFPSLRLRERERQNKASYFHHLDRPPTRRTIFALVWRRTRRESVLLPFFMAFSDVTDNREVREPCGGVPLVPLPFAIILWTDQTMLQKTRAITFGSQRACSKFEH